MSTSGIYKKSSILHKAQSGCGCLLIMILLTMILYIWLLILWPTEVLTVIVFAGLCLYITAMYSRARDRREQINH